MYRAREATPMSPGQTPFLAMAAAIVVFISLSGNELIAQTAAPTISTQPATQRVNNGGAATFTVVAAGAPLTYQWQFDQADITGATGASYSLPSVVPGDGGVYDVVVTNSVGSTTSSNADLIIYSPYVVSALAGLALSTGSSDGTGAAARFDNPEGVAVDGSGNVYVVDTVNCTIREIAPGGAVTTLAGAPGVVGSADGTGAAARFNYPAGIAVDSGGNLYIADTFNSTIRKIAPGGVVTTLAGLAPTAANPSPTNTGSANGTGNAARFNFPRGVAVDGAGNVYVADTINRTIRKITPAGLVTTVAGNPAQTGQSLDGTGAAALFDYPFAVASDSSGNLWVADTSGQTIRAVTPGGVVTTVAGLAGNTGSAGGAGTVTRFDNPAGIAVDGAGNLYIADTYNSTIREITTDGVVVNLAGLPGNVGATNASGTGARFFFPFGIAVDSSGNLYIADTYNAQIRTAAAQSPSQSAPKIQTQPANQSVNLGATAVFSISASGNPNPTYQWFKAGVPIPGATASVLTLSDVQFTDAAGYSATATNPIGSVTSNTATLNVAGTPVITTEPQSQSLVAGSNATLSVTASGAGTVQWQLNGANLPAATSATLVLDNIGTNQAGSYTVIVSNGPASVTSRPATVAVTYDARLTNLSARANAAGGANILFAGFVVGGSGSKKILVRGVGPTLAGFGIASPLARPLLGLYDSGANLVAADMGWGNPPTPGSSSVEATVTAATASLMSSLGAFALPAGSADSAMLAALPAGGFSTQVSGVGGSSGIALAELYDADAAGSASRLANISARADVGPGADVLEAGFVIAGTTSETVLLRGVGPGLSSFGLSGLLARPLLTISSSSGASLASNSGWGGGTALAATFAQVGAFALPAGSADAALVITLPPGAYTAEVSGLNATSGVALVEVYEVP